MPISYTVDSDRGMVLVTWQGDVTEEEYRAHLREMLRDPEALRTGKCLADVRQANVLMSGAQLNAVANTEAIPRLAGRQWKTAVVVSSTVNYGVARQYEILSDSESSDRVFREFAAALAWLLKD